MSPQVSASDRLSLALQVISLAVDRDGVSIDEAAATLGVKPEAIEAVIRPFTDLEYVHTSGRFLDDIGNAVTMSDGQIEVQTHWMQDLSALTPGDAALLLAMIDTADAIEGVSVEALRGLRRRLDVIASLSIGEAVPAAVAALLTAKHSGTVVSARYEQSDMHVAEPDLFEVHEVRWSDVGWRAIISRYGDPDAPELNVHAERLHDIQLTDLRFERRVLLMPESVTRSRAEDVVIDYPLSGSWLLGYFDPEILTRDDARATARIRIDTGPPLRRLLLRLGPDAHVVSPDHLTGIGAEEADRILALYQLRG